MNKFFPFVLLLLCLSGPGIASQNLPALGEASRGVLTPAQELELGRSLLREVHRVFPLHSDPELTAYIESLGKFLVSNTDHVTGDFFFLLLDERNVNAFAMPGGIIGIYSGLLLETRDEAELSAVMAHEIAHVTQRHLARMYARERDVNYATGLAILAGILAASLDPQLGQAVMTGGLAAGIQSRLNYSRSAEAEADRIGMQILANSGFSPAAMADFFERLQALSRGQSDAVPEYLRTHPVTLDRISDARNRAREVSGEHQRDITGNFPWMQARARALADPERSLQRFNAHSNPSPVLFYEAIVAEIQRGDSQTARQLFDRLAREPIPEITRELLELSVLRAESNYAEALDRLRLLESIYPDDSVLTWKVAHIQNESGESHQAVRRLDRHLRRNPNLAPRWYLLHANAADAAGLETTRHESMGEYYFRRGQFEEALRQFDAALLASDASARDIERIEFRRDTIRQIALRDRRLRE